MADLTKRLKLECQWLLLAIQFFTRIPVRLVLPFNEADLNHTSRYVSLVGLLVALLAIPFYLLGEVLYGPWPGALFAVTASILITGALHEDGLADAADGFGAGQSVARTLQIMKDSRIGTYGTLATLLSLMAKVMLLAQLSAASAVLALLLQHGLSRALAISVMDSLAYVQEDANSKVKPVAKHLTRADLGVALAIALLPALWLPLPELLSLLLALMLVRWLSVKYLRKKLGGYTGDCLGAVQQLAELTVLLVLAGFWSQL